jgi:cytidylate kinase
VDRPVSGLLDVQPIVVVTGIPASGKSTVAELLTRRFASGVHVKGDVFRRMVVAGREEMTAEPTEEAWAQLRLRYRLGAATAEAYHEAGFAVVVQDVVVGEVLAPYVASISRRPLVVVVLAPRPDVVAAREAARAKTAYRADMSGITAMDQGLREATPRIGLWLDTSEQTREETVDEIVRRGLAEGSVA